MLDPDPNSDPKLARSMLIDLLSENVYRWEISKRALEEGRVALHWMNNRHATECEIVEYILQLLKDGYPIERVELGEPPGSGGVGWAMKNTDGRETYIKLKIEEDGVEYVAWVLSCHTSVHPKR